MTKITKAVFPVAGLGTRFLPATKAIPKEMLPIIDKPLIEYAVEEAVNAGIKEIIFITSHTKRAIEDHFDQNFELEEKLRSGGKNDFLKKINRDIFRDIKFTYVRQKTQNGLGDAILHSEHLIKNEAFAIILADDLIINNPSCISQLISSYDEHQCSVIGVNEVPKNETEKYGVISIDESTSTKSSFFLNDIVEKPKNNPPSNLAVVGRYVLSDKIFKYLKNLKPSVGGEVQLTDAIKLMLNDEKVVGHLYEGKKFDCGSRHGYVNAIKHLAKELFDD
ncbi:UTP--glucose-1-phosphate uridylyltransferase [SAR86 cluster bacterium SAR86E]|jgi:UTP--glucose-1-phosphate uridylyltransferase|uniref:UTP--glucose-1-phosphate uridylyltransferase n=1 Tax=SAR86 cluster bacterium SAR86E TaxID=1208365 RepID=K6H0L1_9GAMM|nr:UTP--glucose-1-phosphate uridylyltransferase [SAR86 cluster bacterium SAR86E]